jgi:hypothetical protein
MNTLRKKIEPKSFVIGVFLGAVIVFSIAATTKGSRKALEYNVISSNVFQEELEKKINSAVTEGWDFVSVSGPNSHNWAVAVLKREKK